MISEEYIQGFLWAVRALCFNDKTIMEVEAIVRAPGEDDGSDFDRGARAAVCELGDKCRALAIG